MAWWWGPDDQEPPSDPAARRLDDVDPIDPRRLDVAVRRLAMALGFGTDRSAAKGDGLEYVETRRYRPGDPRRSIDWRVTARTGKHHVKVREAPRRFPVQLVIDGSASMTVASGSESKYALALRLAGGLALASLDRLRPVGLVVAGGPPVRAPQSLSREQVWEWLLRLRDHRLDAHGALAPRLLELGATLSDRSLVLVLSDLHDPHAIGALTLLAQRHDVLALHVIDPAELGIQGAGLIRGVEAETGRPIVGPARRAWVDPQAVANALRRGRVDHVLIRTDVPFEARLRQALAGRDRLGRGGR